MEDCMRKLAPSLALIFLASLLATPVAAKVINVEFKFTPYTGDPAKSDQVMSVPGNARVFVNGIPVAEQPIEKREMPVLFEAREISPAVWLPVESLGSLLRKGANKVRIEFDPNDAKAKYSAQLRWASVTDGTTTTGNAFKGTTTNQADEGVETKQGTGKIVFEKTFQADFATDHKWHHYPPVTSISEADKKELAALVAARVQTFNPDFAAVYALLKANPEVQLDEIRKAKCVEKAFEAGVRIRANDADFATTGGPAVVVQGKKMPLFTPADPGKFEKIKGDDAQMCAGIALQIAYPPHLVVVRTPQGKWEIVP
jgi:hypothetical protein